MILVDTSIWVDHLRRRSRLLVELLNEDRVLTHPFVIGELALSGLVNRDALLTSIAVLPRTIEPSHTEAMEIVRRWSLDGSGIGWVDTHLLTATLLSDAQLWTADKRLAAASEVTGAAFRAPG